MRVGWGLPRNVLDRGPVGASRAVPAPLKTDCVCRLGLRRGLRARGASRAVPRAPGRHALTRSLPRREMPHRRCASQGRGELRDRPRRWCTSRRQPSPAFRGAGNCASNRDGGAARDDSSTRQTHPVFRGAGNCSDPAATVVHPATNGQPGRRSRISPTPPAPAEEPETCNGEALDRPPADASSAEVRRSQSDLHRDPPLDHREPLPGDRKNPGEGAPPACRRPGTAGTPGRRPR